MANKFKRTMLVVCGLLAGILLCTAGCSKKTENKSANSTIMTARAKSTVTSLYFKGTLGPLISQSVLSPLDGRITHVLFQYGQQIQKDQPLITLDATKLSEDFRKAVTDFLQKKQSYETGLTSFEGTQALYKAGVVSKEEYTNAFNTQENNTLNYMQSKYELEKLLVQTNVAATSIEQLNLNDMNKVNQTLNRQFQEVKIIAPTQGVALFPPADQKKRAPALAGSTLAMTSRPDN